MHSATDANPANPRGATVELRLVQAYKATFHGEDAEMVLVDLANQSSFYRSLGPGQRGDDRAFWDGARFMFERIVTLLGKDGQDWQELRARAAQEHTHDAKLIAGQYPQAQAQQPLDDYS